METWRRVRTVGGQVLFALCSLAALFLALGVLLVVFQADEKNALVTFVLNVADVVDLGIFDRAHGIKEWTSENAQTKNALFNWGLGALAWIILGRVVDYFVRPTVTRK
ncbi:hypothetical protein [Nocardioides sp.]|uniref:hypothetical protein n=1 Tax=Nocardioides sp. TaxID=35761 RepID=UPI0026332E0D|nr:hypothetical protein [Nocardioides sp.]